MTESEIEAKVIELVINQIGPVGGGDGDGAAQISRETRFQEDLNADSLDSVELMMALEDEFDTNIPDEEAEKIRTVGAAVDYIVAARSSA